MDLITEERVFSLSRMELFEEWLKKSKSDRNIHLYDYVLTKYKLQNLTEESERRLKNILSSYSSKVNTKWNSAARSREQFLTKCKSWLDGENIELRVCTAQPRASTLSENVNPVGRPKVDFESSSFKTKKWYKMPVTVHKILIHSTEVIKTALLPIGQLSEEAQEARNKDLGRFREHNTRKCSRIATNRDLLSMLLVTSDPLINSLREIPKKKMDKFPSEVLKLLVAPTIEPRHTIPQVVSQNENDYYLSDTTDDESDGDD